jgi:hypothetical protein
MIAILYNKRLVDAIRSSSLLNSILPNTQTLQLFTKKSLKSVYHIYKVIENAKLESLG